MDVDFYDCSCEGPQTQEALLLMVGIAGNANATPISFDRISPDFRNGVVNSTYARQYHYQEDDLALHRRCTRQ